MIYQQPKNNFMFFEMETYSKLSTRVQIYNLFSVQSVKSKEARKLGKHIAH